jgi:hypothetical protein
MMENIFDNFLRVQIIYKLEDALNVLLKNELKIFFHLFHNIFRPQFSFSLFDLNAFNEKLFFI